MSFFLFNIFIAFSVQFSGEKIGKKDWGSYFTIIPFYVLPEKKRIGMTVNIIQAPGINLPILKEIKQYLFKKISRVISC